MLKSSRSLIFCCWRIKAKGGSLAVYACFCREPIPSKICGQTVEKGKRWNILEKSRLISVKLGEKSSSASRPLPDLGYTRGAVDLGSSIKSDNCCSNNFNTWN